MTTTRDLKALIRARMGKTGERYATARQHVLNQARAPANSITALSLKAGPVSATSVSATLGESVGSPQPSAPVATPASPRQPDSTPTRVRLFRTPEEAKVSRPALDTRAPLPLSEFVELTGACQFPENHWVTCQLEIEGHICDQEFGNGWVMRRRDGVEGFIGKDCAKRHFGADRRFARETARARHDITVDELVVALGSHLSNPELRPRILAAMERWRKLTDEVKATRAPLPYAVLERLRAMGAGARRTVALEFEYREKVEDVQGNVREVSRWLPSDVGSIIAPEAVDALKIVRIGERLRGALQTARSAEATPDHSVRELRKWRMSLDDVLQCERDLTEAGEALTKFREPTNLQSLVWCCRRDDVLRAVVGVLRLSGIPKVTDQMARNTLDEWSNAIKAKYGNRNFRIP